MIHLPIKQVAYSIPFSYLNMKQLSDGFYLRIVDNIGRDICFNMIPMAGDKLLNPGEFEIDMMPGGVTFSHAAGKMYLTFEDVDTLTVRGEGLGLRLDVPIDNKCRFEYVARYTEKRLLVNSAAARAQFMLFSHQLKIT